MYIGVLTDAFIININAVGDRNGRVNATDSDRLVGVTEGLELLLDSYFGTIGASQLMNYLEMESIEASNTSLVVRLGIPTYTYLTFGINLVLSSLW